MRILELEHFTPAHNYRGDGFVFEPTGAPSGLRSTAWLFPPACAHGARLVRLSHRPFLGSSHAGSVVGILRRGTREAQSERQREGSGRDAGGQARSWAVVVSIVSLPVPAKHIVHRCSRKERT